MRTALAIRWMVLATLAAALACGGNGTVQDGGRDALPDAADEGLPDPGRDPGRDVPVPLDGPGEDGTDAGNETAGDDDTGDDADGDAGGDDLPAEGGPDGESPDADVPGDLPEAPGDLPEDGAEVPDGPQPDGETPDLPGDTDAADAADADVTDVPPVPACPLDAAAAAPGTCVTRIGSAWLWVQGHLLVPPGAGAPDGFLRDQPVLVDPAGVIRAVGCETARTFPEAADASAVICRDVVVSPGLVNGHDHITYAGNTPKSHGTERYEHRNQWRVGLDGHNDIDVPTTDGAEPWGELRQVMAGTTSLFGAGEGPGLLRNLDRDGLEGFPEDRQPDYVTFPLGDIRGEMLTAGCGYPSLPNPATIAGKPCWVPHLAEGINAAARNEVACLATGFIPGARDALLPGNGFIHGIGLLASDIASMAVRPQSLIWSPRSNVDLYGQTAAVTVYARLGANIGLGTDWTASGSMNLLRELRCADGLNRDHYAGFFTDRQLVDMATVNNARAFRLDDLIGVLAPGRLGDLALWDASVHADERAILDAGVADVVLVTRGGRSLYGDDALVLGLEPAAAGCESREVCGRMKSICALRETGSNLAALQAAGGYPAYFCGDPDDEPSCVPARLVDGYDGVPRDGDADGDGVADDVDACPAVFDPPRPLDGPGQPDWDGDGTGDACDPCPLDAHLLDCRDPDPADLDQDGFRDDVDACPGLRDDQADADQDGKGDPCDACPSDPNPGAESCPGTIYDVKRGTRVAGDTVRLKDVLVTGAGTTSGAPEGFFVQQVAGDAAYDGSDHSGIYCYHPSGSPMPAAGDRVDVDGTVTVFRGQIELSKLTAVIVRSQGNPPPEPVDALPADVALGGARATALEGVLVRVADVDVTDVAPAAGTGDTVPTREFVVTGGLRVNDFLHLASPFPVVGEHFTTLAGVLRLANNQVKVEPRDEADLVRKPVLLGFGPALAWALEGETAVPVPDLRVRLSVPATEDTTVLVASASPDDVDVADGGAVVVLAGQQEAAVTLVAKAAAVAPVTLTAQLDARTFTAAVRVVAPAEVPVLESVDPTALGLIVDETAVLAATLDIPNFRAAPLEFPVATDPAGVLDVASTLAFAPRARTADLPVTAVAEGAATVTLGTAPDSLSVPVAVTLVRGRLLLAEVFFNPSGDDNGLEWVRLYNGTGTPVDLANWSLAWGGTTWAYGKMQLSGTVATGECFLVGGPTASAAAFDPVYDLALDFDPDIQNSGSIADGVGLFAMPASALTAAAVPEDAVIYGTTNSSNLVDESGTVQPPDVGDSGTGKSLLRGGSGGWLVSATPTPNACAALHVP